LHQAAGVPQYKEADAAQPPEAVEPALEQHTLTRLPRQLAGPGPFHSARLRIAPWCGRGALVVPPHFTAPVARPLFPAFARECLPEARTPPSQLRRLSGLQVVSLLLSVVASQPSIPPLTGGRRGAARRLVARPEASPALGGAGMPGRQAASSGAARRL